MFAYLVAGLIVAVLVRVLKHADGDPPLVTLLAVGAIAGGIGGLVLNVLQDEDFMAVDSWGFAASAIAALVALAFVQARSSRGGSTPDVPPGR